MRLPLLLALLPSLAGAQTLDCRPHGAMVEWLADEHGEARKWLAINQPGAVVEGFADPADGSWSIVITQPGGASCLVAWGFSWEAVGTPEGDPA